MRRAQFGRVLIAVLGVVGVLAFWPVEAAIGQEVALVSQRPRFLFRPEAGAAPVEVDVSRTAMLQRVVSLHVDQPTIGRLLSTIEQQTGLTFAYDNDFPADRPITFRADSLTVAAALSGILVDTGVDVMLSRRGHAALVKAKPQAAEEVRQGTITGVVSDAETGAPLASVHVQVVGTSIAQITDESGRYTLSNVPAGEAEVQAQQIGYRTQSRMVRVASGETVAADFALEVLPTSLNELVVTVTGEQRVREVGNVVARIQADSLTSFAPVMSFGDLVQGRAPGVLSLPEASYSGQAGRIRIRGLNSALVSNAPIVVVDGIRVEAGEGGLAGRLFPSAYATSPTSGGITGRLADLDPHEIASVEVVKGPSAATLYGTDAANGVLVITTKRGQAGRTRWTVFSEQGLVQQRLDFADQLPDAYYAFGRSIPGDTPLRCTLLQRAEGSCVVDSLGSFNVFTDPATRPFRDAHRQQYGLQVSGGTAGGATYFLSGDYEQETGTFFMPEIDQALIRETQGRVPDDWQVRPNAFERMNLRANLTAPLGERGSVTLATGFVSNQTRQPPYSRIDQVGYRDSNDGWGIGRANSRPAYGFASRGDDEVRRFLGSLATTYSIRDWLTLRGTVGADLSTSNFGTLLRRGEGPPGGELGATDPTGWLQTHDLSIARYSLDLGATATQALSTAVTSKTSVGVQYNRRAQRGSSVTVHNLPLGGETLSGATVIVPPSEATLTTAVAGGYLEEVLSFHDRLFLTGALRFDGGSAFGQDFSVATYPKASLSWVVTDAQAGPGLPGVTSLRLRAAYGASGVQPGPTDALARVIVTNGFDVAGTAAAPGGALAAGNSDLKPERSSELEAGLDLELWSSRVRLELTAYQRTNTDALFRRPLAPDVAATPGEARIENLGSVRNRGLELLMSADLLRGRTLSAGFTATGALNENRLRRLGAGVVARAPTAVLAQQEVGYPVNGLWGFVIESFADANGNGIIEPTELVLSPESRFYGSNIPKREATLSPYVRLFDERLHMSGLFQYRGGFYRNNYRASTRCEIGSGSSCQAVNDAATPLAEQARAVAAASLGQTGPFIEEASYLLLRELSLGLTVPASVARVVGAQTGRVVLAGRNLALLWKANAVPIENAGADPGSDATSSVTTSAPGPSTHWLLRVNLTY